MKIIWLIVPLVAILVGSVLLRAAFLSIKNIAQADIRRPLYCFVSFLWVCLLVISVSTYFPETALSIQPKISAIEQEEKRIASIHQELEEALDIADSEKTAIRFLDKRSEIITKDWLATYRELIASLPDSDNQKEHYYWRFDNVEAYFFNEP